MRAARSRLSESAARAAGCRPHTQDLILPPAQCVDPTVEQMVMTVNIALRR
jgi:hypothetical protein